VEEKIIRNWQATTVSKPPTWKAYLWRAQLLGAQRDCGNANKPERSNRCVRRVQDVAGSTAGAQRICRSICLWLGRDHRRHPENRERLRARCSTASSYQRTIRAAASACLGTKVSSSQAPI